MGFRPQFGLLSGGATAICGASAAMALSAALPAHPLKERATLLHHHRRVDPVDDRDDPLPGHRQPARASTTVMPGIFIGATIHDVAQVVGAGYAISPEAGDTATVVKLMRVAMLLPVIVAIGLVVRSARARAKGKRPPMLPWFVAAFARAGGRQQPGAGAGRRAGSRQHASRWCLVAAIAALGIKTRFREIVEIGWKPVAADGAGDAVHRRTGVGRDRSRLGLTQKKNPARGPRRVSPLPQRNC